MLRFVVGFWCFRLCRGVVCRFCRWRLWFFGGVVAGFLYFGSVDSFKRVEVCSFIDDHGLEVGKGPVDEVAQSGLGCEAYFGVAADLDTFAGVDIDALAFTDCHELECAESFDPDEFFTGEGVGNNVEKGTDKGLGAAPGQARFGGESGEEFLERGFFVHDLFFDFFFEQLAGFEREHEFGRNKQALFRCGVNHDAFEFFLHVEAAEALHGEGTVLVERPGQFGHQGGCVFASFARGHVSACGEGCDELFVVHEADSCATVP